MVPRFELLQIAFIVISAIKCDVVVDKKARDKEEYDDKSLWKKEYENELTDAMLSSRKRENVTRVAQSAALSDNEGVVEKLMESITSSEKYLKKVDSIDFRLNRLDIEVHEKTNSIMKHLHELTKGLRTEHTNKLENIMQALRNDLYNVKFMIENIPRATNAVDGAEFHADSSLDTRLTAMETQMKSIMVGVESIVSIISEVKNRQYSRTFQKNDPTAVDTIGLVNEFRKTLHDTKTRKCDCRQGRVDRSERYPTDCQEIQMQGFNVSGIYKIKPDDMEPFYVLCDLITAGGGWTVFQNRFDGSQDFYKGWSDYKHGFGNLAGEFWLGLEKLNYLTNQKLYELRIEMETQHGQEAYAGYSVFTVGPEHEGYRISTLGTYYGNAGDSLSYHAGQKFSTLDADNDEWKDGQCATEHGGAWWYKECDKSNLNGKYSMAADEHRGQSIYWISFKGPSFPLTKTKMMIRPLPASRPNDFSEQTRKILESPKMRQALQNEPEVKATFDIGHIRPLTRFDTHDEAFFPTYA